MEEIWKDITHYEGLYQVSNLGRVRTVATGKIKVQSDNGKGYQKVNLWKNGKGRNEYVHRLVALAFIPNPEKLPQVNHKDEDKANNFADNLEWCDNSYNNSYGTKIERQVETMLNNGKTCFKVAKCDSEGNIINTYRSMREAERENGMANSALSAYFINNYKQCGGFTWIKL